MILSKYVKQPLMKMGGCFCVPLGVLAGVTPSPYSGNACDTSGGAGAQWYMMTYSDRRSMTYSGRH